MIPNVTTDTVQVDVVEPLTEVPECRTAITALIHKENTLEIMTQYHGLLVYTDGGDILVGWITAGKQRAMDGGRYMTMLIYREEINMTIISHALGAKRIDTTIAAGVVKMLHDENEYGDRVYAMVPDMASTT